jgi:hypothetical protein
MDYYLPDAFGIALDYAQLWPVLPLAGITEDDDCDCNKGPDCPRPGKHPLIKGGLYSATQDEATIKAWVAIWPQANIGIRTGRESDLLVLDVDPRNGGNESLDRLKSNHASLPRTPLCLTGGGGWHYYFRHPGITPLRGQVPGYAGLDIKGDGGYVVAPSSLHHSGHRYQWVTDWLRTPLAPLPLWLLDLIRVEEKSIERAISPRKRTGAPAGWTDVKLGPKDWEILGRLQEGQEGEAYRLLFEGQWRAAGYPTQSEADLALFNRLARLTRGDAGRMYAIFRRTALMRDSNDKPFTYYQLTIQKAIDGLNWWSGQAPTGGRGCR